jgi:hypothetical protein
MIITKQKDFKYILEKLTGKTVFIIGCGECATTCKTGGEEEAKIMKERLSEKGVKVSGVSVPKAPCVSSQVKIAFARNKKEIGKSNAILVMACGLGVQCVRDTAEVDKTVHTACDTLFMGQVESADKFVEVCSACGDCLLEDTAGICPVTRCPKGLLNGPCGGQNNGKCEVNKDLDCVWISIYERMKTLKSTDRLRDIKPPKDYSKFDKPRTRKLT